MANKSVIEHMKERKDKYDGKFKSADIFWEMFFEEMQNFSDRLIVDWFEELLSKIDKYYWNVQ